MHCTAATNSLTYFSRQHSALFCCCIQISAATDHYTLNFLLLNSVDYYFRIFFLFSTLVVIFKKISVNDDFVPSCCFNLLLIATNTVTAEHKFFCVCIVYIHVLRIVLLLILLLNSWYMYLFSAVDLIAFLL